MPLSLARRLTERQWLALDAALAARLAVTLAVALARDLRTGGARNEAASLANCTTR